MIAHSMGAQVIGVDIKDDNLNLASELGAAHILNARKVDDVVDAIHTLTRGGADVSIDALGSLETCRNSVLSLKKRGRHIQVGLMVANYKDAPIPMNVVIAKELEILGSHGMQAHAYQPMIDMILTGQLQPEKLIHKTLNLSQSIHELMSMGKFAQTGVSVINQF
jgi:alcohol dehydrogenase